MNQKRLTRLLQALELKRLVNQAHAVTSAVLDLLSKSDCPLTIAEIAQKTDIPLTPHFITFVENMVTCRYLARHETRTGMTYAIPTHEPGSIPKPLLPLPIYPFEGRMGHDNRSN